MRIATRFSVRSARGRSGQPGSRMISGAGARPCTRWRGRLSRDDLEAIAARCYLELLRGGYTSVAEFLYLHRCGDRQALDADSAIAAAARRSGIGLTLLPTLYQHPDFGGGAAHARATCRSCARPRNSWKTGRNCAVAIPRRGPVALGVAFHSLRAVEIEVIEEVHEALRADPACRCVHIHVAEQPAEVAGCMRQYGAAAGGAARAARPAVGALGAGARDALQRSRTGAAARRAAPRWCCARRPRPTWATAARWSRRFSTPAVKWRSDPTATSAAIRSTSCACWSGRNAWRAAGATCSARRRSRPWPTACSRSRCTAGAARSAPVRAPTSSPMIRTRAIGTCRRARILSARWCSMRRPRARAR